MIPQAIATRYVAPLREGGSLPGIVESDDLGTYVMKFQGAGQGKKALVAGSSWESWRGTWTCGSRR